MELLAILIAVIALVALIFAYSLSSWVGKTDEGTDRMKELSHYIKDGVMAFLKLQYKMMIPVTLILFVLTGFAVNWTAAGLYVCGTLFSLAAEFFGIRAAVGGSARTAGAAMSEGMNQSLKIAFRSGAVMGLCMAGFGLLGIGGVFVILGVKSASVITGFGLGAATAALFGRVGGGIYYKAADISVGLVERAEAGISDSDPRNPAVFAACTGDYAGNAAGMASEMFQSYIGAIIAAITVTAVTRSIHPSIGYPFDLPALEGTVFPLAIYAAGILAAIAGIMFVRGNLKSNPITAVNAGKYLSNGIVALLSIILSYAFFGNFNCAVAVLTGMLIGAVNGKITNIYTFGNSNQLKKIAGQSSAGYLMITEYGVGMLSTFWPVIVIAAGILTANGFAGFYGITLAATGMLSTSGMIAAIDAFVPVAANAGSIVRMARLSDEAGAVTDRLNATGAANMATGKGFASAATAVTALALILSYATTAGITAVNLLKPVVLAGLLLGSMLPILISAMTMNSAARAAVLMIEEVKKQFLSDAGILAGSTMPDSVECVRTGAKASFKGAVVPGLLAVAVPFAVGIFMGTDALGGLLTGTFASGALMSVILANTGGSWNHAEKYIAGDPFKDAAGFSINCFIIMLAMTAVVFEPAITAIRNML